MSDPFKEFVEEMARLAVPEDDTEESRGRPSISPACRKSTLRVPSFRAHGFGTPNFRAHRFGTPNFRGRRSMTLGFRPHRSIWRSLRVRTLGPRSFRARRWKGRNCRARRSQARNLRARPCKGWNCKRLTFLLRFFGAPIVRRWSGRSGEFDSGFVLTAVAPTAIKLRDSPNNWLPSWKEYGIGKAQPWNDEAYQTLRQMIETLPPSILRSRALYRIRSLDARNPNPTLASCDPSAPPPPQAVAWRKSLEDADVDDAAYEKALAASLKTLLCSGGGDTAPILRKLLQRSPGHDLESQPHCRRWSRSAGACRFRHEKGVPHLRLADRERQDEPPSNQAGRE